ncbi:hypothetical protein SKAU_G00250610 [Synaphobranchus kaupii]|uniref:O-methyltransferase C-terminal domain-containing protein n=1 Tax=Synaphobranchus kaupii TaxID=118154 RepID=A0A9Q1F2Y8_SYNKA|nr:hypothetical protein SKAU_G00250610 [Synaphobranchus kaupii]
MVLNPVISKLAGKLVVLASASPRRLEILTNVGLKFEVVPSWFKETLDKTLFKQPHEYAVATAKQKALEVAKRMPFQHLKTPDIVIGADTVVTVDGLILEKPLDKQDAYNMLSRLSGKEHSVFTGVAIVLCHVLQGMEIEYRIFDFYEETKVKFADLSEEMLREYIDSGEPMDKAGGYGIQALGGMLVEYVHGDFLNVVGFPLNHFCKRLGEIYNAPSESLSQSVRSETSRDQCTSADKLTKCVERGETVERPNEDCKDVAPALTSGGAVPRGGVYCNLNFPHRIVDLMDGFKASKCLFAASKLKATERLLDALVSLGLLTKFKHTETTAYRNTDVVNQYLVSSSERSLHGYILHCNDLVWPLFTHLEFAVQEGASQYERAFGKRPEDFFQDAYYSTCDLGGCTGAMAYEFTKAHPGLSVTVFDLPTVVEMSSNFFPNHQHTSRVTFVAGDFFTDDLPKADLYILARILHDLPDEKVHLLLSKLSTICSPGCGLLVSEIFLDEQRNGPSRALLQALSMTVGKQRSAAEYSLLMNKHGFSQDCIKYTENFLDALLCIKE